MTRRQLLVSFAGILLAPRLRAEEPRVLPVKDSERGRRWKGQTIDVARRAKEPPGQRHLTVILMLRSFGYPAIYHLQAKGLGAGDMQPCVSALYL